MAEVVWPGQSLDALVQIPATAVAGTKWALYQSGMQLNNAGQRLVPGGPTAFGGMLTFINATAGGVPTDSGPAVRNVAVSPSRTTGAAGVTLSATLDESTTGGSNVVAAEYFTNASVAPGTGTAIPIAPAVTVNASVQILAATLATWASGNYTIYIRGQDANGNWGAPGSVVLNLDKTGPNTTSVSLTPNPTNGSVALTLRATGDEHGVGEGFVVAAQYTIDGGAPQAMMLSTTTSPVAGLTATIPQVTVAGLAEGQRVFAITSQDDLGNVGAPASITLILDKTGPQSSNIVLKPATLRLVGTPSVTSVRLDAVASDPLVNGAQSAVATAEAFIDKLGAPGTGIALFPTDGVFDELSEGSMAILAAVSTVILGVLVLFGLFTFLRWQENSVASGHKYVVPTSPAIEERYGIRVTFLAVTAAGGLIDMRFRILDANKAKDFGHYSETTPMLIAEDSGKQIFGTIMGLHNHRVQPGLIFHVLYRNTENALKPGTPVTIKVGDLELKHVIVQ